MSPQPPAEPDLGMLLAICCERLVRTVVGELATVGYGHLTPSQSLTVLFIGDGVDTVTRLADRLGMTTQAISKICATLHTEGLLARQAATAGDARVRRLELTGEGDRAVAAMRAAGAAAEQHWVDLVGADTLGVVRAALAAFASAPQRDPVSPVHIRFA
ncbi:MarR family transcriptional regulator [Dactylosporangium aurantiacum]|uniref:MarR family transcriptional regulator n=1 Tax=Dactylosporangium aurantiacum TaxID=35754 RepID=A0A9Q9I915_9ACTN|nr:helix-turn-helix domain-containing protein [Dactylosporangium aurantiacum]MDG6105107.1 helix-turn-helix domain-containing protein [Dactylosporangium aurantiacum]UWZ51632.1 MarR family transcriptional regulator [Dactylosporangium aurantiacum]